MQNNSNQYTQLEQRKYRQETTRTEAWENTSSESQLVSVLHLIGWKSGASFGKNPTTK